MADPFRAEKTMVVRTGPLKALVPEFDVKLTREAIHLERLVDLWRAASSSTGASHGILIMQVSVYIFPL